MPEAHASRSRVCTEPVEVVAENLVTGYKRWGKERVVTRASFSIPPASVVALVGPNGSGKTTLMRTLVGLLSPLGGALRIGGASPVTHRAQCGVAYLPEALQLPDAWTGRGLLLLAAHGTGANLDAINSALDSASVDFDIAQPVRSMSKGMRQRLALAIALVPRPRLILLDEPEAGLDPAQRISLRKQLRALAAQECTVIIASHDVAGLNAVADRCYMLVDTQLKQLSMQELADPERLLALFPSASR